MVLVVYIGCYFLSCARKYAGGIGYFGDNPITHYDYIYIDNFQLTGKNIQFSYKGQNITADIDSDVFHLAEKIEGYIRRAKEIEIENRRNMPQGPYEAVRSC